MSSKVLYSIVIILFLRFNFLNWKESTENPHRLSGPSTFLSPPLSTSFTRMVAFFFFKPRMNLHWHTIITWSSMTTFNFPRFRVSYHTVHSISLLYFNWSKLPEKSLKFNLIYCHTVNHIYLFCKCVSNNLFP